MQIDTDTPIPLAPTDAWQALPARGAWLAALGGAALLFPFAFPAFFVARATDMVSPWLAVPVAAGRPAGSRGGMPGRVVPPRMPGGPSGRGVAPGGGVWASIVARANTRRQKRMASRFLPARTCMVASAPDYLMCCRTIGRADGRDSLDGRYSFSYRMKEKLRALP